MSRRACTSLVIVALTVPASAAAQAVEFNRDIRPLLSEYCFACHGPDKPKRKADLRLDTRDGAFADLGGHFALVAGKPADSTLYQRLVEKNPRRRMPPASTGKTLSSRQIDLIRRWIAQGAGYQKHWAFIPPRRPAPPAVRDAKWVRNPVDRFVLARIEAEGLAPSTEADRRTLIRRLSFDLLGLPPTPAEVGAFVQDRGPNAYEKVVDRLLASKHFGERMALSWLDAVRYGDTGGYHSDNHRDVWLYRDWVISAFNTNKRFDRFTAEQLAGDLLPDAGAEGKIASGYNRLLMTTEEGGAQAKEYRAKYAADRVRNASGVWLGLTMGCAECHDHKFDPVTTKEFYRFASFWADIQEVAVGRQPQTKVPTPEQARALARIDAELAGLRQRLAAPAEPAAGQRRWEESARASLETTKSPWTTVRPAAASSGGATLVVQPDLSVLSTGKNPAKDSYTVTLKTDLKNITAVRLTALRHPSLAGGGLSRGNGNFVLTGFTVSVAAGDGKPEPVRLARAEADFSQPGFPVSSLLQRRRRAGWAVEGHLRKGSDRAAVFAFARPVAGGPGTTLVVKLVHGSAYAQHNIGRFRLDLSTAERPGLGDAGLPDAVVRALRTPAEGRSPAQQAALADYYRGIAPELAAIRERIAGLTRQREEIERSEPQTLVSMAGPPREVRVLKRGNWLDEGGEVVRPGTPASLSPLNVTGRAATRVDLARWLTAPGHPLTARVFVNRLWKLTFGQGIARSLDDFGSQGAWPTHPDLLDWLACEFVASGWDVKHVLRLMTTSAAYRQSSAETPELRRRDPYNHLLARQGRFRLDAELVRDNALAVSGLLSHRVGGPSVKPYQPAGYWAYLNFPTRTYRADRGENQYRRGLYTYWQRTFPHPSLIAFDAPSREECTVDRPRSNTPQQALVLLNDPTYVEAARKLAERAVLAGKTDEERLRFAYLRVLGRAPTAAEGGVLRGLLARHLGQYRAEAAAAEGLLKTGDAPAAEGADKATLAAWTSVARVLLNLHETVTRE
jgi:mono/diheme cytochrome c family protein